MNDFTAQELEVLVDLFKRANINSEEALAVELQQRFNTALGERLELEDLDFEDCLSCKL
jgi:hypothetical protein